MPDTTQHSVPLSEVYSHITRVIPVLQERQATAVLTELDAVAASAPQSGDGDAFHRATAQILQDIERVVGPTLPREHPLRADMDTLATTIPGLKSEGLQTLMAGTAAMTQQSDVDAIRTLARQVAQEPGEQNTPEITRAIADLHDGLSENERPVVSDMPQAPPRPEGSTQGEGPQASAPVFSDTHDERPDGAVADHQDHENPAPEDGPPDLHPDDPGPDDMMPDYDQDDPGPQDELDRGDEREQRLQTEETSEETRSRPSDPGPRAHPSPGEGERRPDAQQTAAQPRPVPNAGPQSGTNAQVRTVSPASSDADETDPEKPPVYQVRGPGLFSRLATAIRPQNVRASIAPPGPQWFDQVRTHAQTAPSQPVQPTLEQQLEDTQKLGRTALQTLSDFAAAPASTIMKEISDAARNDPEGMRGVMSEMKPGGRYEGLRSRFETEKGANQAFATQLGEADTALAAYGASREKISRLAEQQGQSEHVEHQLKDMDAKIGEKAETVPGKSSGTSMLEDLGDKAKEAVKKAIEALMQAFRPSTSASASPAP